MTELTKPPKDFGDSGRDVERLRGEFDKLIAVSKAKELGVSEDDVVVAIRGGRRVFTTRQKLTKDLERQRNVADPERRRIRRAIRDGEKSVVGDIQSRLEDCLRLLGLLAEIKKISPLDNRDIGNALKACADNALQLGRDLQCIEGEIERKKAQDPLLSRLDDLAGAISAARARGDEETAARLVAENREKLSQYESRRRALEPDIHSALHCRCGLLREQRRIMKTQMRLYSEWAWALRASAQEVCARADIGALKGEISSHLEGLQDHVEEVGQLRRTRKPAERPSDIDVHAQNRLLEEEVARLDNGVRGIALHLARLEQLLKKACADGKAPRRMAFTEPKKG